MAKRNNHTFKKYQKEIQRKKKAQDKLDRRQGKNNQPKTDIHEQNNSDWPAGYFHMKKQMIELR